MRILNLYSGIGGNRKLWGDEHDVTAVESDEVVARIYKEHFPEDDLVISDAKVFLLENFKEFDFIWSSPPCQTHSSFRQNIGVRYRGVEPMYPDMSLYEQILFLKYNFDGLWVVENVKPYYTPLIEPSFNLDRHLFWSNFKVSDRKFDRPKIRSAQIPQLQNFLGYDLSNYKVPNKRQVLRNCVNPKVGQHILSEALEVMRG